MTVRIPAFLSAAMSPASSLPLATKFGAWTLRFGSAASALASGRAADQAGAFVVVWESESGGANGTDIKARLFGPDGADFPLARTHLGACDFSVEGKYSYADVPAPGDDPLAAFTLAPDSAGFDPAAHPGLRAPAYDLLPMLRESHAAGGEFFGFIATIGPSTAPSVGLTKRIQSRPLS